MTAAGDFLEFSTFCAIPRFLPTRKFYQTPIYTGRHTVRGRGNKAAAPDCPIAYSSGDAGLLYTTLT